MPNLTKITENSKYWKDATNARKFKNAKNIKLTKNAKNAKNGKNAKNANNGKNAKKSKIFKKFKNSKSCLVITFLIILSVDSINLNGMFSRIVARVGGWVRRHCEFNVEFVDQCPAACVFVRTCKGNEFVLLAVAVFDGFTVILAASWYFLPKSFALLEVER